MYLVRMDANQAHTNPTAFHLTRFEMAVLHALYEVESATAADVAWKVSNAGRYGITTNNRSKVNRGLNALVEKGLATREVGAREPSSGPWGRPPFRYRLTFEGFARFKDIESKA